MRSVIVGVVLCLGVLSCQECVDCPAPPEGFRFQVVDYLERDLIKSSRAKYTYDDISMTFEDAGVSFPVVVTIDTFQEGRVIFEAPFAPDIVGMGYPLLLHVAGETDTIKPSIVRIETYCCDYVIYDHVLSDVDTLRRSNKDDFVFLIRK